MSLRPAGWGAVLAALALAACGRYSDFALPSPEGAPRTVRWEWRASPGPLIVRGPSGSWDSTDVLNPSVLRFQGRLVNLYSGYDGRVWRTGLAESADGATWTKLGMVLAPDDGGWERGAIAANGSAIAWNGRLRYYYQAGEPLRIGMAESPDGRSWTKHPEPVLGPGPYASWDEAAVADPYVIEAGGRLYLFYTGMDRARRQRLGVAVSSDGIRWTKLRANPVVELGRMGEFDENGLGEPAVWSGQGSYWMLYTGRDRKENRRMGLAQSRDGVRWNKLPLVIAGAEPWDSKVVCDATVLPDEGGVRVWFGGGDVARPDQGLNGQIGAGRLTFYSSR